VGVDIGDHILIRYSGFAIQLRNNGIHFRNKLDIYTHGKDLLLGYRRSICIILTEFDIIMKLLGYNQERIRVN
jgi:hypothetical protein